MEIKFITEGMACAKCEARVVEKLSLFISSYFCNVESRQSIH